MDELGPGEVRVWALDLDAPLELELEACCEEALQPEELARAERFPRALDGRRWARARAMLRVLLGDCLGVAPSAIRFEIGAHGKPRLAHMQSHARARGEDLSRGGVLLRGVPSRGADLRFNMAHSGPVAVYALAAGMEVGVDVEARLRHGDAPASHGDAPRRRVDVLACRVDEPARRGDAPGRRLDVLAVARRAFGTSTAEHLAALDPKQREREFLRLWVRHEAALKCLGVGLAGAQQAGAERTGAEWADTERAGAGERPWVAEFEVGDAAVGAVASMEELERVVCRLDQSLSPPVAEGPR